MFAWIATRTGVQPPSPPLSLLERKCPAVALAKADRLFSILLCNFLAAVKNKASHVGVAGAIKTIDTTKTATLAFMNYRFLGKISYHSAILLACVTLSCRPQQAVILSPGECDLVVLTGCVISAVSYLPV